MKVFKFGGASVKNATSIINVAKILKSEVKKDILVVISAMGKMTNALEEVIDLYLKEDKAYLNSLDVIVNYHLEVMQELFEADHSVFEEIMNLVSQLKAFFVTNTHSDYNYIYDQTVSYGELFSTRIVSAYLTEIGVANTWLDARQLIHTDANFRNARVDWKKSKRQILENVTSGKIYLTQGFIAASDKETTTLGREGSDYTAAILAHSLDAESVTIWKDVQGVLNADPRYFDTTILLEQISYSEALEMAFYGASVIHPKTIKPLENKRIPLFVKSFINPKLQGTIVKKGLAVVPRVPIYTLKEHQILISIAAKDFSFMIEHNISQIFSLFSKYKISVNLIQNSAISFSVCVDDLYENFELLFDELVASYTVTYNKGLRLLSIRYFDTASIDEIKKTNTILLVQESRSTMQFVMQ
jgi:aspartate kinase